MTKNLLLVYNANSDFKSKMFDYMHKAISPSSYDCQLCSLTHTNLGQKKEWSEFIESIDANLTVLYKDQFLAQRKEQHFDFPLIIYRENVVLNKDGFETMDLEGLKIFINDLISK